MGLTGIEPCSSFGTRKIQEEESIPSFKTKGVFGICEKKERKLKEFPFSYFVDSGKREEILPLIFLYIFLLKHFSLSFLSFQTDPKYAE